MDLWNRIKLPREIGTRDVGGAVHCEQRRGRTSVSTMCRLWESVRKVCGNKSSVFLVIGHFGDCCHPMAIAKSESSSEGKKSQNNRKMRPVISVRSRNAKADFKIHTSNSNRKRRTRTTNADVRFALGNRIESADARGAIAIAASEARSQKRF